MSASPNSASRLGTKLEIHHGVAALQSNSGAWPEVAEKPNHKACCVNDPADAFDIYNSTSHRFSTAVSTSREDHRVGGAPLATLTVPPILAPLYPAVVFQAVDRTGTTNGVALRKWRFLGGSLCHGNASGLP